MWNSQLTHYLQSYVLALNTDVRKFSIKSTLNTAACECCAYPELNLTFKTHFPQHFISCLLLGLRSQRDERTAKDYLNLLNTQEILSCLNFCEACSVDL